MYVLKILYDAFQIESRASMCH